MVATQTKTQWVNIDDLNLWDRNYNQGDIGAILISIQKFGFLNALRVWQNNTVMAGNHSLMAVRQLIGGGWSPHGGAIRVHSDATEILTVDMSYLSETQAQAFAIADNRTADLAEPDDYKLVELLQDLANDEDNSLLSTTGYDGDDLDMMLNELGEALTWGDTIGEIPDGDKPPFQQMTFTLHDSQKGAVDNAIKKAKQFNDFTDSQNENSNGNALYAVCEWYMNNG